MESPQDSLQPDAASAPAHTRHPLAGRWPSRAASGGPSRRPFRSPLSWRSSPPSSRSWCADARPHGPRPRP